MSYFAPGAVSESSSSPGVRLPGWVVAVLVVGALACVLALVWAAKAPSDSVDRVGAVASVIASWPTVAVLGLVLFWNPLNGLAGTIEAKVRAGTLSLEFAGLKLNQVVAEVKEAVASAGDAISTADDRGLDEESSLSGSGRETGPEQATLDDLGGDRRDAPHDSGGFRDLPLFLDAVRRAQLQKVAPDGALLLVFGEVEGLLRDMARSTGVEDSPRRPILKLTDMLVRADAIRPWHADVVRASSRVRNALAHGDRRSVDLLETEVDRMIDYLVKVAVDLDAQLGSRRAR